MHFKNLKNLYLALSLLALTTIFIACEKDINSTYIDTSISILLVNEQNQNLLAPPAIINSSDINLYYLVNGVPQLFNKPTADAPKGFLINKDPEGRTLLRIFPNDSDEKFPITLLKIGNSTMDTIKCENDKKGSHYLSSIRVWHNGVLKYDIAAGIYGSNGLREITIKK